MSAIFDSVDDVWFFVDPDYYILFFNKKAYSNGLLFHKRELKAGDNILDYARDTTNKVDERFVASFEAARKGEIIREEGRVDYNSQTIWTYSKYIPVYEEGELLGISISVGDITAQKLQEEERWQQQQEIIALSQKRDEFINIASHELKTPLTSLKASVQILTRKVAAGSDHMELDGLLQKASISVEKLNKLIKSLLDSNQIARGNLPLEMQWFNLYQLASSCCDELGIYERHHLIIEGDKDLEVYADKDKIEQVIANLVLNAAKYAPQSLDIFLRFVERNNGVRISIADKGQGIDPEKKEHLFKRYFQGHLSDTKVYSGMGLGLYIAEGIIRQHGGQIGVESEPGEGAEFWFTLPLPNRDADA